MIAANTAISRSCQPGRQRNELSERSYAFLQHFIKEESGIVVEGDKQYLLETRLAPVLKDFGIASLESLVEVLGKRPRQTLVSRVVDAMTTNETFFFRDGSFFDALRAEVLPGILKRTRGKRTARIWSAAASSGQEAYSVAMLLIELGARRDEAEITGTDLSWQVLERARRGSYGQFEVSRGLPISLLTKHFRRSGLHWEVRDELRKLVRFEQLDLRRDLSFLKEFDLILCRNVLIYFDCETKGKLLKALRMQLAAGGLLALGCAETTINLDSGLQRRMISQATFYSRSEDR